MAYKEFYHYKKRNYIIYEQCFSKKKRISKNLDLFFVEKKIKIKNASRHNVLFLLQKIQYF